MSHVCDTSCMMHVGEDGSHIKSKACWACFNFVLRVLIEMCVEAHILSPTVDILVFISLVMLVAVVCTCTCTRWSVTV